MVSSRRNFLACAIAWGVAVLIAWWLLDPRVSPIVVRWGPLDGDNWLAWVLRRPGHYSGALVVAAVLLFLHPQRWRAVALVTSCGALAGIVGALLKWVIGRSRPYYSSGPYHFEPFDGGIHALLYERARLSTPSGDTTMAFAIAGTLAILYPRWRWLFFALALLTGLERLWENAHYPSDVVLGAGLAILWATLLGKLLIPSPPATLARMQNTLAEKNGAHG